VQRAQRLEHHREVIDCGKFGKGREEIGWSLRLHNFAKRMAILF
jgi:hypothetical protein